MSDLLWAAGPRFDRPAHHRPRTFDTMVVSRRVSAGPERITALVGDPSALTTTLPGGGVLAVGPMTASPGIVGTTWNGDGRIGRSGALRRAVRVAVEIASWSADAGEIRISPATRHVPQWGPRRLGRYFHLAHAAADHLRRVLHDPDPVPAVADAPEAERVLPLESAA